MKWLAGTIALLALGVVLQLGLLIYAMYVLLGVLLLSRFFTRTWTEGLDARRFGQDDVLEIGASAEVKVAVLNTGRLAVPWLLLEDSLPRRRSARDATRTSVPVLASPGMYLGTARRRCEAASESRLRARYITRSRTHVGICRTTHSI